MSITRDGYPGHEGHAVGFVLQDGVLPDSGLYREVGGPGDNTDRKLLMIAAGCACGWRSPRWKPIGPAEWSPHCVFVSKTDEHRIDNLWSDHLEELDRRQAAGKRSPYSPPPLDPKAAPPEEGHLELEHEGPDGLRHSLAGRPVHAGDTLELKLLDGSWLPGRYEWAFKGDSLPRFYLGLADEPPGPPTDEGALLLSHWAVLRWPPRS